MAKESGASGGVGFCGLLCLLFIGLKLGGVIGWSWLWVLSPLWIPLAFFLSICGVALAGIGICTALEKRK